MWTYACPVRPDELYHHGVRGMKWGIRRFQNSDGTLTAAGKKRLSKLEGQEAKLAEKKAAVTGGKSASSSKAGVTKKKSVKDMTNEELETANRRMALELNYKTQYSKLNPEKVSVGKKFVDKFAEKTLDSVATGAANAVGNAVGKKLGATFDKILDSSVDKKGIQDAIKSAKSDKSSKDKSKQEKSVGEEIVKNIMSKEPSSVFDMSSDELQKRVDRMRLEETYEDLYKKYKDKHAS